MSHHCIKDKNVDSLNTSDEGTVLNKIQTSVENIDRKPQFDSDSVSFCPDQGFDNIWDDKWVQSGPCGTRKLGLSSLMSHCGIAPFINMD